MVSEELAGTLVRTTDETKKAKAKDFFNGVFLDLQEYRRPFQLEHARRGDRDEGHHQRVGARMTAQLRLGPLEQGRQHRQHGGACVLNTRV